MMRPDDDSDRELSNLLDADPAAEPIRPMWPAVAGRVSRRSKRRFDPFLAFGVPATMAAGLVLGVLTGAGDNGTSARDEISILAFSGEEETTLDEIWWESWAEDESASEGGAS